eukprot:TRINITY_DN4264_c0_g1_i2.p1 TRINITY_DN4264_c0_g1~~TRINITY_DN4264_c0_g1_i2.p1  ORF type:complete len:261 (-),score=88.89 TRINITY_DN4264_c0_g1_i2:106-888(-)
MSSVAALTNQQKKILKDFQNVTGATAKVAEDTLKRHKWNLEQAVDSFFGAGPARQQREQKMGDETKLNRIFDRYVEQTEDANRNIMFGEGMKQFFDDIKVDPEGVVTLAIAWKLRCSEMGVIQREEFVRGFATMGVDTLPALTTLADRVKQSLAEPATYKEMYKWVFHYVKGGEQKRSIDKELGLGLWGLLLDKNKYPLVEKFSSFIQQHRDKAISRDLWDMAYDFVTSTRADLSNFEDTGAWPIVIDEFVDAVRRGVSF